MRYLLRIFLMLIVIFLPFAALVYNYVPKIDDVAVEQVVAKPKVVLNMIVKDESSIICRCLSSVLPFIDYWVIVDTGSSDGTQKVIKDYMSAQNIPGELHERPWKNFGHNRNEALQLAKSKGDYVLFIDADNYFAYDPSFKLPELDKDCYHITLNDAGSKYSRIVLINTKLDWNWVGVLHEAVCCSNPHNVAMLDNISQMVLTDGNRSKDPKKYDKDAAVFEEALKDDPSNSRYVFYLAQSYYDAGNYPKAKENYKKRAKMGGWDQEVFYALLKIGKINEILEKSSEKIVKSYKKAYNYRNVRKEPLYYLASHYRNNNDFKTAYLIAKMAESIPSSNDNLFVEQWIYDYGMALERSISAYWIGKYGECQKICLALLKKDLPDNVRETVVGNLGFANSKLLDLVLE